MKSPSLLMLALILSLTPAYAKESKVLHQRKCEVQNPPSSACIKEILQENKQVYQEIKFERIVDGDTFVADGNRIRLWGINAPEKDHSYYTAATWFLDSLLKQGKLSCKPVDTDRYQRSVMQCLIDGRDVGSLIVQMGLAKDYERYSGGYYSYEQNVAKESRRGLWTDASLEPSNKNP